MLDFHNHLIPGVDDGAASLEESRAALGVMQAQGFRTIITTPHIQASLLERDGASEYLRRVDVAWDRFRSLTLTEFPDLRVERGFEVLIDTPLVQVADARLRLAGTQFILVEFPWGGIPINSAMSLFNITVNGYIPIIAHPERYSGMDKDLNLAVQWRNAGAYLQI